MKDLPHPCPQTDEEKLILDDGLLLDPTAFDNSASRVQEDGSTADRKVSKQHLHHISTHTGRGMGDDGQKARISTEGDNHLTSQGRNSQLKSRNSLELNCRHSNSPVAQLQLQHRPRVLRYWPSILIGLILVLILLLVLSRQSCKVLLIQSSLTNIHETESAVTDLGDVHDLYENGGTLNGEVIGGGDTLRESGSLLHGILQV